jgi:hypothetical protein
MVFNGRGWSRSSCTCHSACEILTAGAASITGQAFHRQAVAPARVARPRVPTIVPLGEGTWLRAP